MANKSSNEIELLKKLLKQKIEDYRTIYNKLVESGGVEIPEELLDQVAGGIPIAPTNSAIGASTTTGTDRPK